MAHGERWEFKWSGIYGGTKVGSENQGRGEEEDERKGGGENEGGIKCWREINDNYSSVVTLL